MKMRRYSEEIVKISIGISIIIGVIIIIIRKLIVIYSSTALDKLNILMNMLLFGLCLLVVLHPKVIAWFIYTIGNRYLSRRFSTLSSQNLSRFFYDDNTFNIKEKWKSIDFKWMKMADDTTSSNSNSKTSATELHIKSFDIYNGIIESIYLKVFNLHFYCNNITFSFSIKHGFKFIFSDIRLYMMLSSSMFILSKDIAKTEPVAPSSFSNTTAATASYTSSTTSKRNSSLYSFFQILKKKFISSLQISIDSIDIDVDIRHDEVSSTLFGRNDINFRSSCKQLYFQSRESKIISIFDQQRNRKYDTKTLVFFDEIQGIFSFLSLDMYIREYSSVDILNSPSFSNQKVDISLRFFSISKLNCFINHQPKNQGYHQQLIIQPLSGFAKDASFSPCVITQVSSISIALCPFLLQLIARIQGVRNISAAQIASNSKKNNQKSSSDDASNDNPTLSESVLLSFQSKCKDLLKILQNYDVLLTLSVLSSELNWNDDIDSTYPDSRSAISSLPTITTSCAIDFEVHASKTIDFFGNDEQHASYSIQQNEQYHELEKGFFGSSLGYVKFHFGIGSPSFKIGPLHQKRKMLSCDSIFFSCTFGLNESIFKTTVRSPILNVLFQSWIAVPVVCFHPNDISYFEDIHLFVNNLNKRILSDLRVISQGMDQLEKDLNTPEEIGEISGNLAEVDVAQDLSKKGSERALNKGVGSIKGESFDIQIKVSFHLDNLKIELMETGSSLLDASADQSTIYLDSKSVSISLDQFQVNSSAMFSFFRRKGTLKQLNKDEFILSSNFNGNNNLVSHSSSGSISSFSNTNSGKVFADEKKSLFFDFVDFSLSQFVISLQGNEKFKQILFSLPEIKTFPEDASISVVQPCISVSFGVVIRFYFAWLCIKSRFDRWKHSMDIFHSSNNNSVNPIELEPKKEKLLSNFNVLFKYPQKIFFTEFEFHFILTPNVYEIKVNISNISVDAERLPAITFKAENVTTLVQASKRENLKEEFRFFDFHQTSVFNQISGSVAIENINGVTKRSLMVKLHGANIYFPVDCPIGEIINNFFEQRKAVKILMGNLASSLSFFRLGERFSERRSKDTYPLSKQKSVTKKSRWWSILGSGSKFNASRQKVEVIENDYSHLPGTDTDDDTLHNDIYAQHTQAPKVATVELDLKVVIEKIVIEIEDDNDPDRIEQSYHGFFPSKRWDHRPTLKPAIILSISIDMLDMGILYNLQIDGKHELGIKRLIELDYSCPGERLRAAIRHGFSELYSFDLSRFVMKGMIARISDYSYPLVSFPGSLTLKDATRARFVIASLKSTPACTEKTMVHIGDFVEQKPLSKLIVESQKSSSPTKIYFDFALEVSGICSFSFGECMTPGIAALNRGMDRVLPSSSDKISPKLAWWDKIRYMLHGFSSIELKNGFEFRLLVESPWSTASYLLTRSSECVVQGYSTKSDENENEEYYHAPPGRRDADLRAWNIKFADVEIYVGKGSKQLFQTDLKIFCAPVCDLILSLAWKCNVPQKAEEGPINIRAGDHYVQLHHPFAQQASSVPDMYTYFRTQAIHVGLDFEIQSNTVHDFSTYGQSGLSNQGIDSNSNKQLLNRSKSVAGSSTSQSSKNTSGTGIKYPSITLSWSIYPRLCEILRGIVPPVPSAQNGEMNKNTSAVPPSFGKLLKRVLFNIRAERPHVMWWDGPNSLYALLLRGRQLDSRVSLKRDQSTGNWSHEALISRFASLEGYLIPRYLNPSPSVSDCWSEFGLDGYVFGLGLEHQQFIQARAMRLTLGIWGGLIGTTEHDTNKAYRLIVDDLKFLWTLPIRHALLHFFGRVNYVIRAEAYIHKNIVEEFTKKLKKKMSLSTSLSMSSDRYKSEKSDNEKGMNPALARVQSTDDGTNAFKARHRASSSAESLIGQIDRLKQAYSSLDLASLARIDESNTINFKKPTEVQTAQKVDTRPSVFMSRLLETIPHAKPRVIKCNEADQEARDQDMNQGTEGNDVEKYPQTSIDEMDELGARAAAGNLVPAIRSKVGSRHVCSSPIVSADGLYDTLNEIYRTFSIELRRAQVNLKSGRNLILLAGEKATINCFVKEFEFDQIAEELDHLMPEKDDTMDHDRIPLDLNSSTNSSNENESKSLPQQSLSRKEVDVSVIKPYCFSTLLTESEKERCIWLESNYNYAVANRFPTNFNPDDDYCVSEAEFRVDPFLHIAQGNLPPVLSSNPFKKWSRTAGDFAKLVLSSSISPIEMMLLNHLETSKFHRPIIESHFLYALTKHKQLNPKITVKYWPDLAPPSSSATSSSTSSTSGTQGNSNPPSASKHQIDQPPENPKKSTKSQPVDPNQQPDTLNLVGKSDEFHVTDIVYTDLSKINNQGSSEGSNIPTAYLGVDIPQFEVCARSRDFFVSLSIFRDLLLVPPPPENNSQKQQGSDKQNVKDPYASPQNFDWGESNLGQQLMIEAENFFLKSGKDPKVLKFLVENLLVIRQQSKNDLLPSKNGNAGRKNHQRVVYEVGEGLLALIDSERDQVRVSAVIAGLRSDHSFSPDGSTKVEFEIQNVSLRDLNPSGAEARANVLDCKVIEDDSGATGFDRDPGNDLVSQNHFQTPFIRVDAKTDAPIILSDYRIAVYELFQCNVCPGARYILRLCITADLASFVLKYLHSDDESDNDHITLGDMPKLSSKNDGSNNNNNNNNLVQSSAAKGESEGGRSSLSPSRRRIDDLTPTPKYKSSLRPPPAEKLDLDDSKEYMDDENDDYDQDDENDEELRETMFTPKRFDVDLLQIPTQNGSLATRNTYERNIPQNSVMQKRQRASVVKQNSFDIIHDEIAHREPSIAESKGASTKSAFTQSKNANKSSIVSKRSNAIIRSGFAQRLSIPKKMKFSTATWAQGPIRRNLLHLVIRRDQLGHVDLVLDIHRNELGPMLKIPPRASINLRDITSLRKVQDETAPIHAFEIVANEYRYVLAPDQPNVWPAALAPGLRDGVLSQDLVDAIEDDMTGLLLQVKKQTEKFIGDFAKENFQAHGVSISFDSQKDFNIAKSQKGNTRITFEDDLINLKVDGSGKEDALLGKSDGFDIVKFDTGMGISENDLERFARESHNLEYANDDDDDITDARDRKRTSDDEMNYQGMLYVNKNQNEVLSSTPTGKETEYIEVVYFKYARIGQVRLELSIFGFTIVNFARRNAIITPIITHRELTRWSKYFKSVRSQTIRKLLTSTFRGGNQSTRANSKFTSTITHSFTNATASASEAVVKTIAASRQRANVVLFPNIDEANEDGEIDVEKLAKDDDNDDDAPFPTNEDTNEKKANPTSFKNKFLGAAKRLGSVMGKSKSQAQQGTTVDTRLALLLGPEQLANPSGIDKKESGAENVKYEAKRSQDSSPRHHR